MATSVGFELKMIAPVCRVQPLATIRRKRLLHIDGTVLVNEGDLVQSSDNIARADWDFHHIVLDAARGLGMAPERAQALIQREVGEDVEAGAIIAGRRGIGSRQLRAPATGRVVAISEVQVLLQTRSESLLLQARIPGTIVDIEPNRGVTIECSCAWVQGVWGNDGLGDGVLHTIGNQILTADLIDISQRGVILVAGFCEDRQAIELAGQVPIRGLVLGSLATRLLPIAQRQPYPIVLTEGFGSFLMNEAAFVLLTDHNGDQATLNAQVFDSENGDRPEVIIPIQDISKPSETDKLQNYRIGRLVRITSGSDTGEIGEITTLLPPSTVYSSGIHAPGAIIALRDGDEGRYPLVNLELIV